MSTHGCTGNPCTICGIVPGLTAYLKHHTRESLENLVYEQACRLDDKDARIIELEAQFSAQVKATGEEMLKADHLQSNWNTMVRSIKEHYDAQLKAEYELSELQSHYRALQTSSDIVATQRDEARAELFKCRQRRILRSENDE